MDIKNNDSVIGSNTNERTDGDSLDIEVRRSRKVRTGLRAGLLRTTQATGGCGSWPELQ